MNRRQAITFLAGTPFWNFSGIAHLLHNEEKLAVYAASIPIYWRMYIDGYVAEVASSLPACLSVLSSLALQPSFSQQEAASTASKAFQLASLLATQSQQFRNALAYAKQAFYYGQIAEDPNLQAASLIRKALVYFHLKNPKQKLQAYQEALQYEAAISPLLRGRLSMGLGEAHGHLNQKDEAKRFFDTGYNILPDSPKNDPAFAYTHFGYSRVYEDLLCLHLQQPQKAWEILESLNRTLPLGLTVDRVELTVRRTRTAIVLGDLQHSCMLFETSLTSAVSLGSRLRYAEICDLYQQMQEKWPHEQKVRELSDLLWLT